MSGFLRTLVIADVGAVSALFGCKTCDKPMSGGTMQYNAIGLDGTATGIVGKLPKFPRPTYTVKPARYTSNHQYLIRKAKTRSILRAIF